MTTQRFYHTALVASLAMLLAYQYLYRTGYGLDYLNTFDTAIGEAPYRYRVLVPMLVSSTGIPVIVFTIVGALAAVSGMWTWQRCFLTRPQALMGTLAFVLTYNVALAVPERLPYSIVQDALFLWGMYCAYKQRWRSFLLLLTLSLLNRETGIFLSLMALFGWWPRRRERWWLALNVLYAALLVLLIRLAMGDAERFWTVERIALQNAHTWTLAAANLIVWLGIGWLFVSFGWQRLPAFVQRAAWFIVPYVMMIAWFGIWNETRLFTPLLIVLVPALVMGLQTVLLRKAS